METFHGEVEMCSASYKWSETGRVPSQRMFRVRVATRRVPIRRAVRERVETGQVKTGRSFWEWVETGMGCFGLHPIDPGAYI